MESKLYRWVFWPLWFIVVPLGLAISTVSLLAGSEQSIPTEGLVGWLRWFAQDQKVPAIIVFFTLFEMIAYQLRYSLPLAGRMGVAGRTDIPSSQRRAFEDAAHLVEEVGRTVERYGKDLAKNLPSVERAELDAAMAELTAAMDGSPFDGVHFGRAHEAAHHAVATHLKNWRRSEFREYSESILIAVGVALLLRSLVFEAFQIPSGSMLPTLQIRDHIFVNKFTYGPKLPFVEKRVFASLPPVRGDVLVFEFPDPNPNNPRVDYIKRAIAIPGDVLEVDRGHPIINGWPVPYCNVGTYKFGQELGDPQQADLFMEFLGERSYLAMLESGRGHIKQGPYHVRDGEFWVLGDNRDNSMDSRAWMHEKGAGVPFDNVKGRAMFVWLSFNERGVDPLGVTWDRLLTSVLGRPRLPKEADASLKAGIERCLATRPVATLPPPPRPHAATLD